MIDCAETSSKKHPVPLPVSKCKCLLDKIARRSGCYLQATAEVPSKEHPPLAGVGRGAPGSGKN